MAGAVVALQQAAAAQSLSAEAGLAAKRGEAIRASARCCTGMGLFSTWSARALACAAEELETAPQGRRDDEAWRALRTLLPERVQDVLRLEMCHANLYPAAVLDGNKNLDQVKLVAARRGGGLPVTTHRLNYIAKLNGARGAVGDDVLGIIAVLRPARGGATSPEYLAKLDSLVQRLLVVAAGWTTTKKEDMGVTDVSAAGAWATGLYWDALPAQAKLAAEARRAAAEEERVISATGVDEKVHLERAKRGAQPNVVAAKVNIFFLDGFFL